MNRSAEPFHTEQEYYKELIACVRLFLEDNPEQDKMKVRAILLQSSYRRSSIFSIIRGNIRQLVQPCQKELCL